MTAETPVAAPPVQNTEEAQVVAPPAKEPKEPKKPKKPKKGEPTAQAGAGAGGPTVAAHPRAARSIALVKGWGGLIGFLLGGYLSLPTSTVAAAGLRALISGVVCYVVGWGASVFVWRRLVILEIKGREQKLLAEVLAAHAARSQGRTPGGAGLPGGRDG